MSEHHITRIPFEHPELLGYPLQSHRVIAFKWGDPGGISDLVIFPKSGPQLVAIVEVKRSAADEGGGASDSHAQVVGQVLKYYVQARSWTVEGIERLRHQLEAGCSGHSGCSSHKKSPMRILECRSQAEAKGILCQAGTVLRPDQIGLHIVVNKPTPAMVKRLFPICDVLRKDHRLNISVWQAKPWAQLCSASRV